MSVMQQRWVGRAVLVLGALAAAVNSMAVQAADPPVATSSSGRVLQLFRGFETEQGELAPIKHHAWSAQQQEQAAQFSQLRIVPSQAFGKQACQLTIRENFPWGNRNEYRVLSIGPDYLSPETDAIRLRAKVLRGKFELTLGSPTVYFGHSDVTAEPRVVSAQDDQEWQTVEFSLHHRLRRNTRRARFGEKSPVIYYTRWIQEPLYLYVRQPSAGELLLDQIEAVSSGQGRPYPEFTPQQVRRVAAIVDFEGERDSQRAFTFFQEPIDLTRAPYASRPDWKPPVLTRVEQGQAGRFSLSVEQRGVEEAAFAGIHAPGRADANALQWTLRADHASPLQEIVLDFIVYVAPAGERDAFPWSDFQPPESWRKDPLAFTYYLDQQRMRAVNYGFYHVRRTVPNGKWTSLVLPCADFICAYGQLESAPLFEKQLPLAAETVTAVGFLSPFGQRHAVTKVLIDDLSWVRVPGTPAELQSFWQQPRVP